MRTLIHGGNILKLNAYSLLMGHAVSILLLLLYIVDISKTRGFNLNFNKVG